MRKKKSPCATCRRVKDPSNCENKQCKLWQNWFIDRWETMRDEIFRDDPCLRCGMDTDECLEACAARRNWEMGL